MGYNDNHGPQELHNPSAKKTLVVRSVFENPIQFSNSVSCLQPALSLDLIITESATRRKKN